MNWDKKNIEDWFKSGTKNEVFFKKLLLFLVMTWLVYQLGYALGAFLANIGL